MTIINVMRNWKAFTIYFLVIFVFVTFFVLFCSKKDPEPPKPLPLKIKKPLPKPLEPPPEPPKIKVDEVKEELKPKIVENKIAEKHEKIIPVEKKVISQKIKSAPIVPVTEDKIQKQPQVVDFDRLNSIFSSYNLNVWASPVNDKEIVLNGYVKNENERKTALTIAQRYNMNITDMINVVTVHSIEGPENKNVNQPLPSSPENKSSSASVPENKRSRQPIPPR